MLFCKRRFEGVIYIIPVFSGYELKKKYGISLEEKRAMFEAQGSKCAACGSTESNAKYPGLQGWHLDHDHATGKNRSVLCAPCNLVIGIVEENVERLRSLAIYIESHR